MSWKPPGGRERRLIGDSVSPRLVQDGFMGSTKWVLPGVLRPREDGCPVSVLGEAGYALLAHVDRLTDTAARMLDAEKAVI